MMKILFITQRFPYPPQKGDKLRPFHFIKHLSFKNEVHLLTFVENDNDLNYLKEMNNYCKCIHYIRHTKCQGFAGMMKGVLNKKPFHYSYFYSGKMKEFLKDYLKNNLFDVICVVQRMAQYFLDSTFDIPIIVDQIDTLSLKTKRRYDVEKSFFKRKILFFEYKRLRCFEQKILQIIKPYVIVASKDDGLAFDMKYLKKNIFVIGNGTERNNASYRNEKKIDLIFTGDMAYFPNERAVLDFVRYIYFGIKKHEKSVNFYVVGMNPSIKIRKLHGKNDIVVTGFVEDIKEYLSTAKIFVAFLKSGSGIQNKILEAMAIGLPVVTTTYGNGGICAENGKNIIIEDEPDGFLNAVLILIKNVDMRSELGANARRFIEKNFSWQQKTNALQKVLLSSITKSRPDVMMS